MADLADSAGASRSGPLAGRHVAVTRPEAQARTFCAMLEQAGARVTRFPVIEIRGPNDPGPLRAIIARLSAFDIAVFVSANAVQRVVPDALAQGTWPRALRVAAIGASTARALEACGLPPDIVPESRFDSEALLESDVLQAVEGLRVVIFRGDGGREHLATTLRSRGAEVVYAEAYRRALPEIDPEPLCAALQAGNVDAITVTSGESLQNLVEMLGSVAQDALLRRTVLVVGAGRVADRARELGIRAEVVTAEDPTDAAMFRALVTRFGR
jgi:uroporphyrinogen-III synthase